MRIQNLILTLCLLFVFLAAIGFADREPSDEAIVFVSRRPVPSDDGCPLPGFGPKYRTAKPGGRLLMRTSSGDVRVLVDESHLFDVADPCVSWDARTVFFSGVAHPDSQWRIYRIGIDGSGLTPMTFTDRNLDLSQFGENAGLFRTYDDFDPCQLPDGRVVFASTRYPSLASYQKIPTTNLWILAADGSESHRITTERNGAEEPTVDPLTGRLVYSRWWVNIDRPSNVTKHGVTRNDQEALTDDIGNVWQAVTIKPDGSDLKLYAGFPRTRPGLQAYKTSILSDSSMLCSFVPELSLSVSVDAVGVRRFNKGADWEKPVAGVWSAASAVKPPFATDAVEWTPGTILMAYSANGKDFGIYSSTTDGKNLRKMIDLNGTLELEPQVVKPRSLPPIWSANFEAPRHELPPTEDPSTYEMNGTFRFDCMNVFQNGDVDQPIPDAPRIAQGLRMRIFLNSQRRNAESLDAAIPLGEKPVFFDGGIHFSDSPADVPMFEQLVDANNRVVESSSGKFAHVSGYNFERMGSGTKCAGCHIGHTLLTVPINSRVAEWFNAAPSADVTASSFLPGFQPSRIVDRQARTGGDTVAWVAGEGEGAWVRLTWPIPVEIREVVLYNIGADKDHGTSVAVSSCDLQFMRNGQRVFTKTVDEKLAAGGTRVVFDPIGADALQIVIRKSKGAFRKQAVTGLAEVETILRLSKPLN